MKNHKTICLSLVVRNQNHLIQACLDSVKGLIDQWVIIDCESADGTIGKIYDALQGVPGEIYSRGIQERAHLRTEAFHIAKKRADYVLVLDPDEKLLYDKAFVWPTLDQDSYHIQVRPEKGVPYTKEFLISSRLNGSWKGALHQAFVCPDLKTSRLMEGIVKSSKKDEESLKKEDQRLLMQVQLLQKALEKRPNDPQILFDLALSANAMGDEALALGCFQKRANLGGEQEQVYVSLLEAGRLIAKMGKRPAIYFKYFHAAYELNPERSEALRILSTCYHSEWHPQFANLLFKSAAQMPQFFSRYIKNQPSTGQFLMELAEHYIELGEMKEAAAALMRLTKKNFSPDLREQGKERLERLKWDLRADPSYEEALFFIEEVEKQHEPEEEINPHHVFQKASLLLNQQDLPNALTHFQQRTTLKGNADEVSISFYASGRLQEALNAPVETYLKSYIRSYESAPSRAEALNSLAQHHLKQDRPHFAYLLQKAAVSLPKPNSQYISDGLYDYNLWLQLADTSQRLGKRQEALVILRGLSLRASASPAREEILQKIQSLEPLAKV